VTVGLGVSLVHSWGHAALEVSATKRVRLPVCSVSEACSTNPAGERVPRTSRRTYWRRASSALRSNMT
jgi:hypothetical protein